ncbi:ABC transporter substrate-binding protein [Aquamicrobium segne]|uniref:ABC transporter substrate-binding protein n=1 Tax=Aquamicrobium segne TaxID=469547 RepID=A0ABW0H2Z5_9HYPH
MKLTRRTFGAGVLATSLLPALGARAQANKLTAYMGPPEPTCAALIENFDKSSGISTTFLRLSAGEAVNRVRAEKARPQASIVYGIGLPSMMTLKDEGLLEAYRPAGVENIPSKYVDPEGYWTGIDVDFIGFVSNKQFLEETGLKAPQSWEDLLKPEYKGQVCLGSPATSGTGYLFIATVLQIMGEKDGWEYLKRFNENVAQYTRSGIGPTQLVGRGEVGIGILFAHDILGSIHKGFPLEMSLPEEGTGYDLFCAVMLKDAPEPEAAKAFLDWAVTAESQEILAESGYFDVPTNTQAKIHDLVKPYANAKLIDFDFAWAGNPDTRKEIVERFQNEILAGRN